MFSCFQFDEDEDDDGLMEPDSVNTQYMTPVWPKAHQRCILDYNSLLRCTPMFTHRLLSSVMRSSDDNACPFFDVFPPLFMRSSSVTTAIYCSLLCDF